MFFSHSCDKNTKHLKNTFNFVIRFIFLFSISIFFLQNFYFYHFINKKKEQLYKCVFHIILNLEMCNYLKLALLENVSKIAKMAIG